MDKKDCCCSERHKDRSEEEKKKLMNRLKRIEGQIRGIEGMVEKDAYCPDILVQVSAVTSFRIVLIKNYLQSILRHVLWMILKKVMMKQLMN